jgi:predicted acyl esterase
VIGPVRVRLHVQASRALIDLHARLCDVTQRGRSINVSDGIVRLTDATPDTAHPVEFALWPIAHTFRRGHRIRLQVSGGAHPRYGRNHGTAEPYATSTRLEASDRTVLRMATRVPLTASGCPAAGYIGLTVDGSQEAGT